MNKVTNLFALIISIIFISNINASNYKIMLDKAHYENAINVEGTTTTSELISKLRINTISSLGQNGWASFCSFNFKKENSSDYVFGNILSGASSTTITFENGSINLSSHYPNGSNYYGEYLLNEHKSGTVQGVNDYWLSTNGDYAGSAWVEFIFSPAIKLSEFNYADSCAYNRKTNVYDFVIYDDSDQQIGTYSVSELQSTSAYSLNTISFSDFN